MTKFATNASGDMLLLNLIQVTDSISGSVVPLACRYILVISGWAHLHLIFEYMRKTSEPPCWRKPRRSIRCSTSSAWSGSYLIFVIFLHQAENFDKYDKYWCKYEAWSGSPKVPAAEDHQAWNNTTETQRGQITFRDHVKKRMPQICLHACAYFGFLNVEDSFE